MNNDALIVEQPPTDKLDMSIAVDPDNVRAAIAKWVSERITATYKQQLFISNISVHQDGSASVSATTVARDAT